MRRFALVALMCLLGEVAAHGQTQLQAEQQVPASLRRPKQVLPVGDKLLVYSYKINKNRPKLEVTQFDANLESTGAAVKAKLGRMGRLLEVFAFPDEGKAWFLAATNGNYQLFVYDLSAGKFKKYLLDLPRAFRCFEVMEAGGYLYLTGDKLNPKDAHIFVYRPGDKKPQQLKFLEEKHPMEATRVEYDASADRVMISLYGGPIFQGKRQAEMHLYALEPGQVVGTEYYSLTLEEDKKAKDAVLSKQADGSFYLNGNYVSNDDEVIAGFYVARFERSRQQYVRYFPLSDFPDFHSYMAKSKPGDYTQTRFTTDITDYKKPENRKMRMHPVQVVDGNLYLLAEVFYAARVSSFQATFVSQVFMMPLGYIQLAGVASGIEGYYYSHAALLCIDGKGEILHRATFELREFDKPRQPGLRIALKQQADGLVMTYKNAHVLMQRTQRGAQFQEKELLRFAEKPFLSKSIPQNYEQQAWYANYYISSGSLKQLDQKGKPRVFFLHKHRLP